MLLKKLEMIGFKSFINHTELVFEPGITAVIGPNGCGKSNISDAIRWVLGEQSAKALRGSKMEDVIFNGTETQKAAGMAEVSLTLGNEDRKLAIDYSEVTITRRTFRSGESEYLLNKTPCRLKDIYSLLSDTGIGTDGYSLLEQGKMDLILSSKPGDRRAIFEEAAGITKYKTQRDEALRKLEATAQNLLRLNDIITEVRRQINSLERQARRAEKYHKLKQEMDFLHKRLLLQEHRETGGKLGELAAELEAAKIEEESLTVQIGREEAQLSQLHLVLAQDEEALSRAASAVHALETELAQVDRRIEVGRTQAQNFAEKSQRAGTEGESLREKERGLGAALAAVKEDARMLGENIEALRAQSAALEEELRRLTSQRETSSLEAENIQQQILALIQSRTAIQGETDSLNGKVGILEEHTQGLRKELSEVEALLHQASQQLEQAGLMVGGKHEEIRGLESSLSDQNRRKQALEGASAAAEEALAVAQVNLTSAQARLTLLEELSKTLSGYEAGPRTLLLARQEAPESLPQLVSLAHVVRTRPEYELAVELALGRRLQSLLCGTTADAMAALNFLREKDSGRAGLLPSSELTQITEPFAPELLAESGVLGPLASILEAGPEYQDAVRWLAGHLLLVDNLETALRLKSRLPVWGEFVTLRGEIATSSGLVTGGSTDSPERGLLGREREITELHGEIGRLQAQIQERRLDRERLKSELQQAAGEISQASAALQDVQIAAVHLEREQSSRQADSERLSLDSKQKQQAIQEADQQAADIRRTLAERARQLGEFSAKENGLKDSLNRALDNVDHLRAEENRLQGQLSEKKVELASHKERLEASSLRASGLEGDLKSLGEQAAFREEEQRLAKAEEKRLEEERLALEESLKGLFARKDQAQGGVQAAQEVKQGHQSESFALETALKDCRHKQVELGERRHAREMALQEAKIQRDRVAETLMTEYHVDLGQPQLELIPETEESPSAEPAPDPKARVEELKAKIAELGAVNPAAAEEYQELEQRHSLLNNQIEDLKSAKSDLHKVINKINQTTRERFMSTFEAVEAAFRETFKLLFKGGEARLTLLDHEDLLEAGIDIVARPPGKRLQTISLLSGGEKALTAIALLFALFKLKPSPFCVLDEIDAPLDDANIGRFASVLQEFSSLSQFIVITHSKLTMEKATVLYGITMEESGVSRLVSAKFKDEKPMVAA